MDRDFVAFEAQKGRREATFWQQLKATVKRNILRKRRNTRRTINEIFPPLYFMLIIIIMKLLIPVPHYPEITSPQGTSSLVHNVPLKQWPGLLVAPNDTDTRQFVENLQNTPILQTSTFDVRFFKDDAALKEAIHSNYSAVDYALIFSKPPKTELSYQLRVNYYGIPATDSLWNDGNNCRDIGNQTDPSASVYFCSATSYYFSGFSSMQTAIDLLWIQSQTSAVSEMPFPQDLKIQLVPKSEGVGTASVVMRSIIPFYLVIGFSQFLGPMLIVVVTEKEKKIKESLRMVGLRDSVFWLSWLIVYALMVLVMSLIAAVILYFVAFKDSNIVVLFLLLFEFGITMIMFAFILTTLFSKAKVAGGVGALSSMLLGAFYYLQVFLTDMPSYAYWFLALLSPTGFAMSIDRMLYFEGEGLDLDLWDSQGGIPIAGVLIMLVVDAALYGLLAAWLDNVLPTEYGTRRPPWFCFQASYWRGSEAVAKRTVAGQDEGAFEGPDIERVPANITGTEAVRIWDLKKEFKGGVGKPPVHAVNGVNLKIYPNEITAILGHNGAGKTTLFNMLTGMTAATSGTASVCGYDISDSNQMAELRKMTGICPQHDVLFDELTPKEHLEYFARIRGLPEHEVDKAVQETLMDIDLKAKADTLAKKLSGGQKRKLSVGIALIGDPKIIFFDEPTAGVDPYSRRHLWSVLKKKKEGKVILLTTHFMDEADILADRKAVLSQGSLRCYGTSLFLKNRFGVGYHLTLVMKPEGDLSGVTGLVKSHISSAKQSRIFGREVSYVLPRDQVDKFPGLFTTIEQEMASRNRLGIDSYGASMTTLEEVFLRLGEQEEEEKTEEPNGTRPDLNRLGSISSAAGGAKDETPASIKDSGYKFERITTQKSSWQTYKALVWIRFLKKFRDPGSIFVQMVLPIVYIIVGIGLTSISKPGTSKDDALMVTNSMYRNAFQPHLYGYQNFTAHPIPEFADNLDLFQLIPSTYSYSDLMNTSHLTTYKVLNFQPGTPFDLTLVLNDTAQHVLPVAVNALTNTIASYFGLPHINLTSLPITTGSPIAEFDGGAFVGNMFVGFTYVIMAMGLSLELIEDREMRVKNQLRVNGLNFYLYYGSFFTILGPMMWILCGIILGLIQAFNMAALTFGPSYFLIATLYIIFPIPSILFASTSSYIVDTVEGGQGLFGLASIVGFIPYLIVFMLSSMQVGTDGKPALIAHIIFSFIYPLYIPFGIIYYTNYKYIICTFEDTCDTLTIGDFLATPEIYVLYVALVFHTLVWFVGLKVTDVVKDGGSPLDAFPTFKKQLGEYKNLNEDSEGTNSAAVASSANEDQDVRNERAKVASYLAGGGNFDHVVAVHNISKNYGPKRQKKCRKKKHDQKDKGKLAVKNVSFSVPQGQVFGLLGPNGAGKTTTMRIITAEEAPTSGRVKIGPYDITGNDSPGFELLGYCPQFDALWKKVTVREHLEAYAAIRGVPPQHISRLANQIMKGLRIEEHAKKYANDCSGGTKRKLSYGLAMLGDPKVVLMDEPSSGMDPQSKRFVWDTILASFTGDRGAILTTHSMEEADALCTRVGIMVKGEFRCLGSTQHLKNLYGAGYVLELKMQQETSWHRLDGQIKDIFDVPIVQSESFADRRTYLVPQAAVTSLGHVFSALEALKHEHNVEEYSFSQTTLEQVFIKFAKDQEIEEHEEEEEEQ